MGVANRSSSEEGKGDFSQSSEPLLNDDHHHINNLDDNHSHSSCAKGTRWTQIQRDRSPESKASGYGALALVHALHRPRWTMRCDDDYDKEKGMRRVRRRLCARLGVGTLIFL